MPSTKVTPSRLDSTKDFSSLVPAAFNAANSSYSQANGAFGAANSAASYANSAFTAANTAATSASNAYGFKNRFINGGMVIDQRNAGASIATVASTVSYCLDRWYYFATQAAKFTIQQNAGSVTPPAGFSNYLGVTSTSAYSATSSDEFTIGQRIEGYNIADLTWGTANAATVAISFWVRSSLTGTFGATLNNTGAPSYPFTYTISQANTWEYKTITIAGPTIGTWSSTNLSAITVNFSLGSGSSLAGTSNSWTNNNYITSSSATVSVVGTSAATWYITGVQLEKGSTATGFDYRPYGLELGLCQRYFFPYYAGGADAQEPVVRISLTSYESTTYLPVMMRATPTIILPSGSTYGRLVGYTTAFVSSVVSVTGLVTITSQSNSAIHLVGTNASMTQAAGAGSISFDTLTNAFGVNLSAEL